MALAYTELTEELGRLQALSSKQTEILRKASQEQASPGKHGWKTRRGKEPVSQSTLLLSFTAFKEKEHTTTPTQENGALNEN